MAETIRTVIVDDEPLARKLLRSMLATHADIELVGEYGDGQEALNGIIEQKPDLVFLDVQMPKLTGIEVLEQLGPDRDPEIVFVTAYDQYALRAFEVNAVDYLLKPFDDERFDETLDRVRARLSREAEPRTRRKGDAGDYADRLDAVLRQLGSRPEYAERIAVRRGERIYLQPVADIEVFESEGKYVRIHTGGEEHVIRETMLQLDEILDPRQFIRISRSAIINIASIAEIQLWFRGDYMVILKSGRKINTTRSYRSALKRLIDRAG